ncbi:MAG: trimethylamine methyltransferase family protein [Acidithiobacillales bacterium]
MAPRRRPTTSLLSRREVESVIRDAIDVLSGTGVLVENRDAQLLLRNGGAAENGGRFNIPERMVRIALATAAPRIRLFGRDGAPAMDLGGNRVHFDPGSAAIHLFDAGKGRRRAIETGDVVRFARLVDGLPNYAAQSTALTPGDVPGEIADRYRLYLILKNAVKPVVTGTFRKDGFAPMRELLLAVRGGDAELRRRPLAIFDCCPSPPLKWSDLTGQALVDCARSGIPAELVSMPLAGATSPVTLREAAVQQTAENLSGVVIHQLAAPGAPLIWGGSPAAMDMRHGTTPMGAVETMMINLAASQAGKRLGLPTHAYMGLSDSKCPDYQAGLESGVGTILAALAGINVVSGPGMLDFEICQSFEKLLLDHDACGMALRLVRGIERREDDAAGLIRQVVESAEFLSHPHTRKHWREEITVPSPLVARDTYGDWESRGARWAHEEAAMEVERRLATSPSRPPSPDLARALDEIMLREARAAGMATLPVVE